MKKGQRVVQVIVGGGVRTASLQTVLKVSKGVVQIENSSLKFRLDDDDTAREIEPAFGGWYAELIPLES